MLVSPSFIVRFTLSSSPAHSEWNSKSATKPLDGVYMVRKPNITCYFQAPNGSSNHTWELLRNSCPYTTYPTFSFPPMEDLISPLTNSSPHRTNTRTHPHSSPMPRNTETRSVPIIDASSCFTFLVLIRFALPPVLRSAGLYLAPRMFSSLDSAAAPHSLRSTGSPFRFPFLHHTILYLFLPLVQ